MTTCSCVDVIKCEGACYRCIKLSSRLLRETSNGWRGEPTTSQLEYVGVTDTDMVGDWTPAADVLSQMIAALAPMPWERLSDPPPYDSSGRTSKS